MFFDKYDDLATLEYNIHLALRAQWTWYFSES